MVEAQCFKPDSSPDEVVPYFRFTKSFQLHHVTGVYSPSNRNECQKIFLEVKCVRAENLIAIIDRIV
jgi:hypothetical protein